MQKEEIQKQEFLFGKKNYIIMLIGIIFIALGFIFMAGGGSDNPEILEESLHLLYRIEKSCIDSKGFVPYFTAFGGYLKFSVANTLVTGQIAESLLQLSELRSSKDYSRIADRLISPWIKNENWRYTLKGRIEYSLFTKLIYKLLGKNQSLIGKGSSFIASPLHKYYHNQSKDLIELWIENVREASKEVGFRIIDLLSSLEILIDMFVMGNTRTSDLIMNLLIQGEQRMENGLLLSGKKDYAYHVDHQVDFYVILKKLESLNFHLRIDLEAFRLEIFDSFYRGQYVIERLTKTKKSVDNILNTKYIGLFLKLPLADYLLEKQVYNPKDVLCQNILSDR